jgi:hypothetical protein
MKKTALSLVLGASLMVSSSAFALTAMTDSNMKSATGQAGVTIALDDVTLYQSVGATTYTDTDGLASVNGAGDSAGIKISGVETLTTIRAILDGTDRGGFLKNGYETIMTAELNTLDADGNTTISTFTSSSGHKIDVTGMRDGYAAGLFDASGNPVNIGAIKVAPLTIDVSSKVQALSYGMAYNSAPYIGAVLQALGSVTATADHEADLFSAVDLLLGSKNMKMSQTEKEVIVKLALEMEQRIADNSVAAADQADYITNNSMDVAMDGVNVAGVVIGLPTIEIVKTGSVKTVSITGAENAANNDDAFIAIKTGESSLAVLGGYIEICPH